MSQYFDESEYDDFDNHGDRLPAFRELLEYTNADVVKQMARHWGDSKANLNKQACIQTIVAGLKSPEHLRRVITACTPFEQTVLRLLCQCQGHTDGESLAISAAMLVGPPQPAADSSAYDNVLHWLKPLFEKSLIYSAQPYSDSVYFYQDMMVVLADPEVLHEVIALFGTESQLQPTAFVLPQNSFSQTPPRQTQMRRPQAVALMHSTFMRAVSEMGAIKINRTGARAVSAASINKLEKLMQKAGWRNTPDYTVDGQPFPSPISAYILSATYGNLLKRDVAQSILTPTQTPEDFGNLSYAQQTGYFVEGITIAPGWAEVPSNDYEQSYYSHKRATLRSALCFALAALPDSTQFISIRAFSAAIFQRIGEHFSVGYRDYRPQSLSSRYSAFGKLFKQDNDAKRYQKELDAWHSTIVQQWDKVETALITGALKSWLFAWGLVELGLENGECVSFRLTPLGRTVLVTGEAQADDVDAAIALPARDAWVVQPNFDVLVYLERVSAPQLSLIERCAERVSADQHAATYRLTRLSVYDWLERGGSTDVLLASLESGSAITLPPNVKRELQGWAAQRERITLRQFARLIEFATAEERDAVVASGQAGSPLGERFFRIEGRAKLRVGFAKQIELINYAQPLPACLSLNEEGEMILDGKAKDLLVTAQLDDWAERRGDNKWQLTEASVKAAAKRGIKLSQLLALLQARLKNKLPALMSVVLPVWAGEQQRIAAETAVVVRCLNAPMLDALMSSARFKPYLRVRLAPDVALVDVEQLEAFKAQLKWAGLVAEVLK